MKLSANGLAVKRGERTIFAGLSFDLGAGEAIVVTGPNGSGKSTLLKAMAGLLSVSEGELALDCQNVSSTPGVLRVELKLRTRPNPAQTEWVVYNYQGQLRS